MCWSKADGGNCNACQKIFDDCIHDTSFINDKYEEECVFCNTILRNKNYCPYCKTKFRTITTCSQSCESR